MSRNPVTYRGKRAFDLAVLVVSSPLTLPIGLATALAIWLTDGTPVLFRQERAGVDGRAFHVLKFRTMSETRGASGELLSDRDRLTKVGRILRQTSLDEVPQLINVLRGEMSIVGPRPLYMRYVPHYTEREKTRLDALPGITGLAQTSGRNAAGWRKRLDFDVQYVERNSLIGDIRICLQTALKAVRSEGVSIIAGESGDPLDVERQHPSQGGLYLRKLYSRDLPLRVKWMTDQRVRRHMSLPENVTLESTNAWYIKIGTNPNRYEFAVEDCEGQVVAMTGLRAQSEGSPAEFYIFVEPDSHGQGIGQIATQLTVAHARNLSSIPSITLTVARANIRAIQIYRKLGFSETRASADRLWMELPVKVDHVHT
ncbi:GNAT family N-acetyltransferase [Dietzia psychralcaliphila]|uniref:GNAT family N-acetyltransferase n=1 Tax=Dietzia psychralcaliphila TaxID=139021 RepID=UPI001C1DD2EF|nr:GNAT family N-acetyltransferase [Dietzia psychralcaliphila]